MDEQTRIHSIEGQRDSMAKRLRTLSAENAKLSVELFSLPSAADSVQEQLKTIEVTLSTTTDKKQKLIQEMETLPKKNGNLQNKLKSTLQLLLDEQTRIHSIEGQRYSMAKRLRTFSAENAKLSVEVLSLPSPYGDHVNM